MNMTIQELRAFCKIHQGNELIIYKHKSKWRVKLINKGYDNMQITLQSERKRFREFGCIESVLKECGTLTGKISINIWGE